MKRDCTASDDEDSGESNEGSTISGWDSADEEDSADGDNSVDEEDLADEEVERAISA